MKRRSHRFIAFFAAALVIFGCTKTNSAGAPRQNEGTMQLTSSAFQNGGEIPAKHTCAGANVSPSLAWSGAPAGTQSFALIADDPDAPSGDFTHWILYGLSASEKNLPENVPSDAQSSASAVQGMNDFGKVGYGGPCPPPGPKHHYHFTLYALNAKLALQPSAARAQLEQAMRGHILAQAELVGTFGR
jgi:Raf kinase inhibitor-like YbhB/YbcL family protein